MCMVKLRLYDTLQPQHESFVWSGWVLAIALLGLEGLSDVGFEGATLVLGGNKSFRCDQLCEALKDDVAALQNAQIRLRKCKRHQMFSRVRNDFHVSVWAMGTSLYNGQLASGYDSTSNDLGSCPTRFGLILSTQLNNSDRRRREDRRP